jgi:hypothetical protein
LYQSMVCQSVEWREAAQASVESVVAFICFASFSGLSSSLVIRDPVEVSPVSREMMLPYGSIPIQFITDWPSLFPRSYAHSFYGSPYGFPASLQRRGYGVSTFQIDNK